MTAPVFVVVGHVNRGKSSLVSTLAADENVEIAAGPGTTRHCRAFPMRVDARSPVERSCSRSQARAWRARSKPGVSTSV